MESAPNILVSVSVSAGVDSRFSGVGVGVSGASTVSAPVSTKAFCK